MSWTNDFIRIPFAEHGRTREGADCWGLVRIVYAELLKIDLPTLTNYTDTKDKTSIPSIISEESSTWEKVKPGDEGEFDVAVFRMCGFPMHVGIVIKPNLMLHCERGIGTCVTDYTREMQWSKRLEGFYRYAKRPD